MNKKSTQSSALAPKHPYASPQIKLVDINLPAGMLSTSGEDEDEHEGNKAVEVERNTRGIWI